MKKHYYLSLLPLILIICLICSCGGGGGGGSAEVATTNLLVEPTTIEVGGSQTIRIELKDVTDNLNIKIRYPDALTYVENSARFYSGDAEVLTNPAFDVSENEEPSTEPTATPEPGATSTPAPTSTPTPTATPTVAGTASQEVDYDKRYTVFFLTRDAFAEDNSGTLIFRIRAREVIDSGRVELDVDLDDPSVTNSSEFSVDNPQFEAEENISIRVRN